MTRADGGGPSGPAERELRRRIAEHGPISFAEFMDVALYGEGGYYTNPGFTTGADGDFFTAPDTSPVFGRLLGRQVAEIWERIGRPEEFEIVEAGPGRGLLARGLVEGLAAEAPELHASLVLTLDDVGTSLRARQREALAGLLPESRLRWARGSVAERAARSWTGVLVANELLDALPVHRVARSGGALSEIRVGVADDGRLCDVPGPPDEEVRRHAERYGAAARDGREAEVGLAATRWVAGAARSIERGALLLVDYGHEAPRLHGDDHPTGTLVAYAGHRQCADLYQRVGGQDLTAHVNWTAVDDAAAEAGLARVGRVTQDRFLLALGLGAYLVAPAEGVGETTAELQRRLALRQLVLPQAMGRRFQVSIHGRGVGGPLRGLGDPEPDPRLEASSESPGPGPRRIRLVRDPR